MKKFLNILAAMLLAVISTSCLTHDLEELEVFSDKDITGVQGVYWRYFGTEKIPGSGEVQVKQVRIPSGRFESDTEAGVCSFVYKVENLPQEQVSEFTVKKLVVVLNISTAALIEPVEGSPKLGVPGDWSKPNKYKVTAADGTNKIWTVSVSELK